MSEAQALQDDDVVAGQRRNRARLHHLDTINLSGPTPRTLSDIATICTPRSQRGEHAA